MNSAQDTLAGGLPHSEIPGSPIARISPGLFAACHVLHRLSVPRHPPDALASRLITASPSPAMPHHRRAQGQAPTAAQVLLAPHATVSHEDTSLGQARRTLLLGPACPPRSHHNSLFTLQSTPAAITRGAVVQSSPNVAAPGFAEWCRSANPRFAGGGGERIRTDDLLLAKQALSQLSF